MAYGRGVFDAPCAACGRRPSAHLVRARATGPDEAAAAEAHFYCARHRGEAERRYARLCAAAEAELPRGRARGR